jgi:hypothetical protein
MRHVRKPPKYRGPTKRIKSWLQWLGVLKMAFVVLRIISLAARFFDLFE